MEQIGRIASPDYMPSTDDILRCRVKTLGIVETSFHYKGAPSDFTLVDVGGQRTERRKWIHVFDDVTIVLFVVSLSEYDLTCEEDNATNRLTESLQLFGDTVNNKYFARTNLVVFYNKNDLFLEKVGRVSFSKFHPEYHVRTGVLVIAAVAFSSLRPSTGGRDGRRCARVHSQPLRGSEPLATSGKPMQQMLFVY